MKPKGPSGFKKVSVFAFNNAILLGRVNTRSLENNPMVRKKIAKRIKFPAIVSTDAFDVGVKLGKDIGKTMSENWLSIRFMLHQEDPCKTRKIINNSQKIMSTSERRLTIRTPNITMN